MRKLVFSVSMEPSEIMDRDKASIWQLIVFASGDFGFNLYWQSATLYLLFYYTEVAHLTVLAAATIYFAAAIWDGVVSLAAGLLIDRFADVALLKRLLIWGAVPLNICFVLVYVDWSAAMPLRPGLFLLMNILFRTAYAAVNLPYLALSARLSRDRAAQSLLSGLRMLGGILAGVIVADFTVPMGRLLAQGHIAYRYMSVAGLFAAIATILIIIVGLSFEGVPLPKKKLIGVADAFRNAMANRAFIILMGAMMATTIATTALEKMVLYYFKYNLRAETAGQQALTYMVAASAIAVPFWVAFCRRLGVRLVWLVAAGFSALILLAIAIAGATNVHSLQLDLIILQCAIAGLNFGLWAMLPEVLDYGMQRSGVWQEGMVYGLNALLQRIALGIGTLIIGLSMNAVGFKTDTPMSAAAQLGLHHIFLLLPAAFFGLSAVIIYLSPLAVRRTTEV